MRTHPTTQGFEGGQRAHETRSVAVSRRTPPLLTARKRGPQFHNCKELVLPTTQMNRNRFSLDTLERDASSSADTLVVTMWDPCQTSDL